MVDTLRTNIDQLAAERADRKIVDNELELARKIQASSRSGHEPARREQWQLYAENLRQSVAGDYHDCWRVVDGRLAIVMADVSGKGVPAAFYMAVTRTMLHNLAQQISEPSELLNTDNRFLLNRASARCS